MFPLFFFYSARGSSVESHQKVQEALSTEVVSSQSTACFPFETIGAKFTQALFLRKLALSAD
jgi:hypothetical protein